MLTSILVTIGYLLFGAVLIVPEILDRIEAKKKN